MKHSYPYFRDLSEALSGTYSFRRLLILLSAVTLIFALTINSSWKATPDSALYLELGESIASGKGYVYNEAPHTYVPPGFPLILSAWINLFGADFFHYRGLMAALGLVTAFLGLGLVFRLCGPEIGIVIGGLFTINHTIVLNSTYTSSDIPFTMLCLLAFHIVFWASNHRDSLVLLFLAAFFSGLPALVRINGLGLPPALAIYLWSIYPGDSGAKRFIRPLLFLGVSLCLPMAWEYYKSGFPVSTQEGEYFRAVTGRSVETQIAVILNAAWEYLFETAYALTGISMRTVVLELILFLGICCGFIMAIRSGERLFTVFTLVQALGLLLSSAGSRYIAPLIPGLYLFLGLGVTKFLSLLKYPVNRLPLFRQKIVFYLFMLFAVTNLGANVQTIYQARNAVEPYGAELPKDTAFFSAAQWIRKHDPDARILSMNPRILRYLTGAKTTDILRSGVPEHLAWVSTQKEISLILEKNRPNYLFVDSKNGNLKDAILKTLTKHDCRLIEIEEARSGSRFSLWKILPCAQ